MGQLRRKAEDKSGGFCPLVGEVWPKTGGLWLMESLPFLPKPSEQGVKIALPTCLQLSAAAVPFPPTQNPPIE
jgi:hypothetical protein